MSASIDAIGETDDFFLKVAAEDLEMFVSEAFFFFWR